MLAFVLLNVIIINGSIILCTYYVSCTTYLYCLLWLLPDKTEQGSLHRDATGNWYQIRLSSKQSIEMQINIISITYT